MKRAMKGLAALFVCGALNFGLTADAQAAELESINPIIVESQEADDSQLDYQRHKHPEWGRRPPPPPPPPRRDWPPDPYGPEPYGPYGPEPYGPHGPGPYGPHGPGPYGPHGPGPHGPHGPHGPGPYHK